MVAKRKDVHEDWRLPCYKVPFDVHVAKAIICEGFRHGVDFAFSDEFRLDHAFIVPLAMLSIERRTADRPARSTRALRGG